MMLFKLRLKKRESHEGQPAGTSVRLLGNPAIKVDKPSMVVTIPTRTTSMSHAMKRCHQKANFNPSGTSGGLGAAVGAAAEASSSIATAVPHLGQYRASSGSSFPQFLQYGIPVFPSQCNSM